MHEKSFTTSGPCDVALSSLAITLLRKERAGCTAYCNHVYNGISLSLPGSLGA